MSGVVSGLSILVGLALGIGLRLLPERLMADKPRPGAVWPVELGLAFAFSALTGVLLVQNPSLFSATGGALGLGLTAYAATSGALAFMNRDPRRLRSVLLGFAHFAAASAAASAGLLLVVAVARAG